MLLLAKFRCKLPECANRGLAPSDLLSRLDLDLFRETLDSEGTLDNELGVILPPRLRPVLANQHGELFDHPAISEAGHQFPIVCVERLSNLDARSLGIGVSRRPLNRYIQLFSYRQPGHRFLLFHPAPTWRVLSRIYNTLQDGL